MPPPASFYTITAFPYSQLVTQADFNAGTHAGGTANRVWFKYIPASDHVFGFFCNKGGTNNPRMKFYETSALTLIKQFDGAFAWWRVVTSGVEYWIEIQDIGGTSSSDFDFTVQADTSTLNPAIDAGDLIINDDTTYDGSITGGANIPAAVLTSAGVLKGFKENVPGGEVGDSIPSGVQLWHDRFQQNGNRLVLFDADLGVVSSFNLTPSVGVVFPNIYGHSSGKFYVVNRSGADAGKISTVSSTGVDGGVIADIGDDVSAIGVNEDETIAYYALTDPSTNPDARAIHRWDLVNDVALSDLYTISELATDFGQIARTGLNLHPGEILVLADDTVVTFYHNEDIGKSVLLHVDPSGSLLHSYTYLWSDGPRIDHIKWDPSDPSYVRLWLFTDSSSDVGRIGRLNLSTGALTSFDTRLFSSGVNQIVNDPVMFGPSSSCTMVTAKRSAALEDNTDTGEGGSETIPTCCEEPDGGGGGDVGTNPDPVGTLPPWMATCTGGGLVDSVADLADGESWL